MSNVHGKGRGHVHALFAGGTLPAVAEVVGLVDFLGNRGVMETHDNFGGPTLL